MAKALTKPKYPLIVTYTDEDGASCTHYTMTQAGAEAYCSILMKEKQIVGTISQNPLYRAAA